MTRFTSWLIQYYLHNATVKALRRLLAAGSVLKPAVLNLDHAKSKINDQYNFKFPNRKAKGPTTKSPVATANSFSSLFLLRKIIRSTRC
ncbi:hypothetical protein TNCT_539531 [Trichonephila clavata]|uniref:Uncharacterized protein n=1 Tax=Trichonephila clavata TaxID=2740835 RepID=A0A8X6FB30_TRICU|nr:hypothetical protein TNCT_539531 [Trichonephila clavata]